MPQFPEFKPIEIGDRDIIKETLWKYQPESSEFTFTNLFIWRDHYGVTWSSFQNYLLFCFEKQDFGLQPMGSGPLLEVTGIFLEYLKNKFGNASIERADKRLADELAKDTAFSIELLRDHFDYVYRSDDLINLAGRKFHSQRNHLNTFNAHHDYEYSDITHEHISGCLETAEKWCKKRSCEEDISLAGELEAIKSAFNNFEALQIKGGVIKIDGKIEAFTLGELLNESTAVIHIEKADQDVRGLYTVINQQFAEHKLSDVPYINREQDLGEPQLRRAKESYRPDHMVEKFKISRI
jgi:uncharacterized protein